VDGAKSRGEKLLELAVCYVPSANSERVMTDKMWRLDMPFG